MKRAGVIAILVLAFFGLADSAYLTQHVISGTPLVCNIQSLSGCNIVASSQYSKILGIPLAELGVLFYGVLFILAALELVLFDQLLRRVIQVAAVVGALASIYFTSVQVFLIGALCIYCSVSAGISILILLIASFLEPLRRRTHVLSPHLPMPPR